MERHGDHGTDLAQVHVHHAVIVGHCTWIQFLVVLRTAVDLKELADGLVSLPDGGQTGGLCGHNVNANTEICAQLVHAGAHELHDFVVHIAICKCSANDRQSHILGAYALDGLSVQVNANNAGHLNVVGLAKKLFYKLWSALAHGHSSQSAISGVAVRSKDHSAAAGQHLPGKLMDDCLVRRYIHTAVLLCACETEHMVILVDGSAHCTKGVVAVGQYIGNREFLQARCSGCLDNSHECDVVGGQFIEFDLKAFHISGGIMVLQYIVCHGLRCCFFLGHGLSGLLLHCGRIFHDLCAVHKINAFVVELYHLSKFLLFFIFIRQFILSRFPGKVNLIPANLIRAPDTEILRLIH